MKSRSINDEEISLIKSMLGRGMSNSAIQFFFNRKDRPVNSGRITGIRNGSYSNSKIIPIASDDATSSFIESFDRRALRIDTPITPPTVSNGLSSASFKEVKSSLQSFVGNDVENNGNYEQLPISQAELNVIISALDLGTNIVELPQWSQSSITFFKGITAALEEFQNVLIAIGNTIKTAVPIITLINVLLTKMYKVIGVIIGKEDDKED